MDVMRHVSAYMHRAIIMRTKTPNKNYYVSSVTNVHKQNP